MNKLGAAIAQMPEELIRGGMCDRKGDYCAVGFMAHLIGIPDGEMMRPNGSNNIRVYQEVEKEYGLRALGLRASVIFYANDGARPSSRRKAVIAKLVEIGDQLQAKHAEDPATS